MKREALAKVNGFSEKPEIQNAEDYHLWLNLLLNGASFYGQSDILAAYRLHKTSSSSIDYESNIQCLAAIHDLTKEDFYWQKVIPFFNRNRIYSAIRLIKHEPPHIFNNKLKIYLMWGGYKKISTLVSMPFIRWSKKLTTMTVYKLLKGYEQ